MTRYLGKSLVIPSLTGTDTPPAGYIAIFNKNGTITFKDPTGAESTGGGGGSGSLMPGWVAGTTYEVSQIATYQGVLFVCRTGHAASTHFRNDLDKWESLAQGVVIAHQVAHGWDNLESIYRNDGVWYKATASSADVVSSHVILESSADWILAASQGDYEYPGHGLTPGLYYSNPTYIGLTPGDGLEDVVLEVTSSSSIRVVAMMPAISRVAPADDLSVAANISVSAIGFAGNLNSSDTNIQSALEKVDGLILGGARVEDWAASTTYHVGDMVRYNGIPFFTMTQHASVAPFSSNLANWKCLYGFGELVTQTAHGFTRWKPIYYTGSTWAAASSSELARLATHVVIESSANIFLAVSQGVYTYAAHGLTTGAQYLKGSVLSLTPDVFENIVLQVRDANTVEVVSYLPAIRRHESGSVLSDFELVDRVQLTGSTMNVVLPLSLSYSWLKVVCRVSSATPGDLLLRLNDDAVVTNYPCSYKTYNGSSTTNAAGAYAGVLCGSVGSTPEAPGVGEVLIGLKNVTGEYRTAQAKLAYMVAGVPIGYDGVTYWSDTTNVVSSVRLVYGTGVESVNCDIQIFGKV